MSSDDEPNEPDKRLSKFFNKAGPDGPADVTLVQQFLDLAAATHFMPGMAEEGRAQEIVDNGFTSKHTVASLSEDDLRGMGFLPGHARKLADHLGANLVDDGPRGPPKAEVDAITAANMVAQQSAAMVAAAVADGQKPAKLRNGSDGEPTVGTALKFLESHSEKQSAAGYCLAPVIKKIMSDPKADIDADVLGEPALSSDRAYYRMVASSLSLDQMEEYSGEGGSACKLLQSVICSIVNSDTDQYLHALGEFKAFDGTQSLNGIKNRYEQFCAKPNEVRFHTLSV